MRPGRSGFTLIEVLVVIAILGILLSIGWGSYERFRQTSEVRSAAEQLASSLKQTRASAKRDNARWSLSVVNATTFKFGPSGGTVRTVNVIPGVQFSAATVTTAPVATFDPPWGAMTQYQAGGSSVPTFTVVSTRNANIKRVVKVVSLLGEVSVQ